MKKFTSYLLSLISFVFLISASVVSAQTPTTTQTNFPFTINGQTCNTKAECRVLCEDPVNRAACKALNPNRAPKVDRFSDPTFAAAASEALGCSTATSCKAICSLAVNFEKCDTFAQQNKLDGGYDKRVKALSDTNQATDPNNEELKKIKEIESGVATDQNETLKEFCDHTENQAKCTLLAKKLGLRGGQKLEGPGGCQSAETCRLYCDDPSHFSECKSFEITGLNGCTSELSCYNELQSHADTLKTVLLSETDLSLTEPETPEASAEVAKACDAVTQGYQGKTVTDFANDLSKSGVCNVLPKTGVPGKNSNCDAYLNSSQPFSKDIFEKICEVKPVLSVRDLQSVDTQTASTDLGSYSNWCKDLPSTDQSTGEDWKVVPSLCENFVTTFQDARSECDKPADQRAEWLSDSVAYSRYCLSAPKSTSDYAEACKADPTSCTSGGFDWYCKQSGNSCVPLYQGRPIDKAVETFADAGVVKDGDQVSLVLDESTQDFAQNALSKIVEQSGATSTFQVVSVLPDHLSTDASFVGGTGVTQRNGNGPRPFFRLDRPTIDTVNTLSPTIPTGTERSGSKDSFAQPWFLIDAFQTDRRNTTITIRPTGPEISGKSEQRTQTQEGWGAVKQNEQKVKEEYLKQVQEKRTENAGFIPQPKQEIKIDTSLFKPQSVSPATRISPIKEEIRSGTSSLPGRVEPTIFRPAGTSTNELPRPTAIPVRTETSGTSGSSSTAGQSPSNTPKLEPIRLPEPTSVPHIEPTSVPIVEPTKTTTSTSGSTTTTQTTTSGSNSGSGSTTSGSGTDATKVQGIHTEEDFWGVVLDLRREFFGF